MFSLTISIATEYINAPARRPLLIPSRKGKKIFPTRQSTVMCSAMSTTAHVHTHSHVLQGRTQHLLLRSRGEQHSVCQVGGSGGGGPPAAICQAGRSVNKGRVGGDSRTSRVDRVTAVTFYTDTAVPQFNYKLQIILRATTSFTSSHNIQTGNDTLLQHSLKTLYF